MIKSFYVQKHEPEILVMFSEDCEVHASRHFAVEEQNVVFFSHGLSLVTDHNYHD